MVYGKESSKDWKDHESKDSGNVETGGGREDKERFIFMAGIYVNFHTAIFVKVIQSIIEYLNSSFKCLWVGCSNHVEIGT